MSNILESIRFVLIGYGHIGKVYEKAISQMLNGELVAIIDPLNIDKDIPHFTNMDSYIDANIPADVVIVATPNSTHFSIASRALEAGYHVVVEKPITLSSIDLSKLIFLADQHGKRLFSMLQLRYSPVVQWVQSLLEEKSLGEVYMVNTQCYWNRNEDYYKMREWHGSKEHDGGVLFTQFSHFVDILHYWFQELKPKDIRSYNFNHKNSTEFADSGYIHFEIPKGGNGSIVYTTSVYEKNFESNITIIAEKGTIQITGQYMNEVKYINSEGISNPYQEPTERHFHQKALEEIQNSIKNNLSSILEAKEAINVIRFLEVVS